MTVDRNMSDEEAKAEVESIQAEIAKSRGEDTPEDKKPVDDVVVDEEDKGDENADDDKHPDDKEDAPDEDDKGNEPKKPKTDDRVPLPKFMQLKKDSENEIAQANAKITELTDALRKATSSKGMEDKIAKFSETSGMPVESVRELAQIILDEVKPAETNKRIEDFIKKQEADQKFDNEFAELLEDVPGAADRLDEIKAKAFEEGNLSKSLFEIYHRLEKPADKKKTGESSRPSRVAATVGFDVKKVIETLKNDVPGALKDLTPEQQDQVFEHMNKTGSRYISKG